jgi:hypothetical protein
VRLRISRALAPALAPAWHQGRSHRSRGKSPAARTDTTRPQQFGNPRSEHGDGRRADAPTTQEMTHTPRAAPAQRAAAGDLRAQQVAGRQVRVAVLRHDLGALRARAACLSRPPAARPGGRWHMQGVPGLERALREPAIEHACPFGCSSH